MRQYSIIFLVVMVCLSVFRVSASPKESTVQSDESPESSDESEKYGRTTIPQTTRYGCYQDAGNRQLGDFHWDLSANSPAVCAAACKQARYKYAGVENGNQCFCGNMLPPQEIGDVNCNKDCNGSVRHTCGGYWTLEVYDSNLKLKQNFARVGCFQDKGQRQLGTTRLIFPMNSPAVCIAACRENGYKYAGVENGDECHCGNLLPSKRISDSKCNKRCNGVDRSCGAAWILEVFHTGL